MGEMTNERVFEKLYDTYAGTVYKIAYSILQDKGQAEDLVHDTFIKLIPRLQTLTEINSDRTKSHIGITVKNAAIDQYRKNKRERENCTIGLDEDIRNSRGTAITTIMSAEDRVFLKHLLGKLDSKQREIIKLHCFYGLNYKEIADVLGISETAAGKRFERAKAKVKSIAKIKEDAF